MIIETDIYKDKHIDYIFHLADIHIPNDNLRHPEYRSVFKLLYSKLKKHKKTNSLIVIAGDIIDKGDKITPDCIRLTKEFFENLSKIFPTVIMAGNHDDNVRGNLSKTDAITAILKDNNYPNLHYLNQTAIFNLGTNISLGIICVFDEKMIDINSFPPNRKKLGMYHGMVEALEINQNHNIPTGDYKFTSNDFLGYDMVFLGDIHKHFYLNSNETIAYCGSLIQLSHGEDIINHGGCIHWDLNKSKGTFMPIQNDYGFITLKYQNSKLEVPESYPKLSRIRIKYYDDDYIDNKIIRDKINVQMPNTKIEALKIEYSNTHSNQNISNYLNDDNLFQQYLNTLNYPEPKKQKIIDIHNSFIHELSETEIVSKSAWKIKKISFKNILCYKNKQEINFTDLGNIDSLWGILGKNAQGKSSILKIIIFSLFGKIPDTPQSDIVNKSSKNKSISSEIEFSILDIDYKINRSLSKVRLFKNELDGEWQDISEPKKADTEKKISNIIGDIDVLLNTNISLQENHSNLINLKNSEQLNILKKILSLDIYDFIHSKVKDKLKYLKSDYKDLGNIIEEEKDIIGEKISKKNSRDELLINKNHLDLLIINDNKKSENQKLNIKINNLNYNITKLENTELEYNQEYLNNLGISIQELEKEKDILLSKKIPIEPKFIKFDIEGNQNCIHNYNIKKEKLQKNLNNLEICADEQEILSQINTLTKYMKSENLSNLSNIKKETKNLNKLTLEKKEIELKLKEISKLIDIDINIDEIETEYLNYQKLIQKVEKMETKLENTKELYQDKINLLEEDSFRYNNSCSECLHNKNCNGIIKLEKKIDELKEEKENQEKDLGKLQKKVNKKKQIETDYENLNNYLSNQKEYANLETQLEKLNLKIDKLELVIDNYNLNKKNITDNKNTKIEIDNLGNQLEDIKLKNKLEIDIEKLGIEIEKLNNLGNRYYELEKQIELNKQYDEDLKKIKKDLGNMNLEYKSIEKDILEYNKNHELLMGYRKEYVDLGIEINNLGYNSDMDSYNLKSRMEKVCGNLGILDQDLNNISGLEIELPKKMEEFRQIKLELDYYSCYETITNWKGYPIYLIKKKCDILENQINRILSVGAHFTCKVLLEEDKLIFYSIIGDKQVPIKNCSGFEKFILSLAIRMGLITISNYMTPNFFIIDEGFGTMDHNNQHNIVDLFDNLKSQFELVFVITHIEELKQKIKNKLVIDNYKIKK